MKNAGENARPSAAMERPMRTHRFGRKLKLPATVVIKHQIRMLMAQDELKKTEAQFAEQSVRGLTSDEIKNSMAGVNRL